MTPVREPDEDTEPPAEDEAGENGSIPVDPKMLERRFESGLVLEAAATEVVPDAVVRLILLVTVGTVELVAPELDAGSEFDTELDAEVDPEFDAELDAEVTSGIFTVSDAEVDPEVDPELVVGWTTVEERPLVVPSVPEAVEPNQSDMMLLNRLLALEEDEVVESAATLEAE